METCDKYDKDLGISYNELEKEFKVFLDEYKCWNRANKEMANKFQLIFKKSLRTLQRWRKNLLLGNRMFEDSNHKYRRISRIDECYFCERKIELLIHHKDKNRKNNDKNNLLILCPRCHKRLHLTTEKTTDRTTPKNK